MNSRILTSLLATVAFSALGTAQTTPLGAELVSNGDFETGDLTGWIPTTGGQFAALYGSGPERLPFSVSLATGGGSFYVGANSSSTNDMEQSIALQPGDFSLIDTGMREAVIEARLGGITTDSDDAQLEVFFLDGLGASIDSVVLGPISNINRINETNMILVQGTKVLPSGTRSFRLRTLIQKKSGSSSTTNLGSLDNVSVQLRTPVPLAAVPLDQELLINGGFNTGVTGQPSDGWTVTAGPLRAEFFGAPLQQVPSFSYGTSIGGFQNSRLLITGSSVSTSAAHQTLDVSGNSAAIDSGQLEVAISGFLGGFASDSDAAEYRVRCIGALGQEFGRATIGPVSNVHRAYKTILVKRDAVLAVPPGTRELSFEVEFNKNDGSSSTIVMATADELSATLRPVSPSVALPFGTELLLNGGFENPQVVEAVSSAGWIPTVGLIDWDSYGVGGMPDTAFAQANGAGFQLVRGMIGSTDNKLVQTYDLSGNQFDVDQGTVSLSASGLFGGILTDTDFAELNVRYLSAFGQIFKTDTIGGVSAVDRGNQTTLLLRSGSFPVPPGTRSLEVELSLVRASGSTSTFANGLADELSVMLCNNVTCGVASFPGTGEDLVLFSSVGANPLTAGPGFDSKLATTGDQISLQMKSVSGIFVGSTPFLVANVHQTGQALPVFGSGIQVNFASAIYLINGAVPAPFTPLLPMDGLTFDFAVPPGLVGTSLRLQPVVVSPLALNGLYATGDGHEIILN